MHQVTEIVVDGADLYSAVELANSVIPSRTPMESLKNILVQAADGFLTISAGDSETSVRAAVLADVTNAADFAVLGSTLKSVLSDSGGKVRISVTDRQATLHTDVGKFVLPLSNLEGLVPSIGFDSLDYLTADLSKLRLALAFASRCVSEVKGGNSLSNVLIDPANGRVAGCDARRLYLGFVPWDKVGDPAVPLFDNPSDNHILLSTQACAVLQRLQGSSVDAIFLSNTAVFRSGTVVVACKISVGRYPNLTRFVSPNPNSMPTQCEVMAGPLAATINRVRIVTTEESRRAIVEFSPEAITASSSSSDLGQAESSIPVQLRGPAVSFMLDPRYMAEFLGRVDKSAMIRVGLKDFESAMFMDVESQGCRYVTMPIVVEA